MSKVIHQFTIILFALILTACQGLQRQAPVNQLILHKDIQVGAGDSFIHLVAPGSIVSSADIGTYELSCRFHVPRPKSSAKAVIQADEFVVSNIVQYPIKGNLVSANTNGQLAGFGNFPQQDLTLSMTLSSATQPGVKALSCKRFADSSFYLVPTINQAAQVLGSTATLCLTGGAANNKFAC